ncbi:hypothetical protein KC316_g1978 [Hortaea werneckii]|nr:hypothetical protein KC324_g1571 [Hortaea werneckii]KAI7593045.1 hypothetical protein KC316_g1978 [Hortaea werneckii]
MYGLAAAIYLFFTIATGKASLHAGDNAVGSIWTFPNETWIENLAARENGMLLCTSLNRFAVYQVDPFGHTAVVVHQFDSGEGVLGITKVQNDVWVVATSNVNLTTSTAEPGSAKIWRLDVGAWSLGAKNPVKLIKSMPDVGLPDGLTTLDSDRGTVLLADASKSTIWHVDTTTGKYTAAINSTSFTPGSKLPLGVDGIHTLDGELYFTNPSSNLFGKIAINYDGTPAGPIQTISTSAEIGDDFAVAEDGTAYIAGNNTLWRVKPDGQTQALVGGNGSTAVQGITSATFARTSIDRGLAYCVQAVEDIATYSGYPTTTDFITLTSASFLTATANATRPYLLPGPTLETDLLLASGTISDCAEYRNYKTFDDDDNGTNVTYTINSCYYVASSYGCLQVNDTLLGTSSACGCFITVYGYDNETYACDMMADDYSITVALIQEWNTWIGSDCDTGLYADLAYDNERGVCIAVNSLAPTSTASSRPSQVTSTASMGPTQTGIVNGCTQYYTVQSGNSCAAIDAMFGITFKQFYAWNPAIGSNYESLWLGYAYCVVAPTSLTRRD